MKQIYLYVSSFWKRSDAAWKIWKNHKGLEGKIWAIRLIVYYTHAYLERNFHIGLPFIHRLGNKGHIPMYEEPVGIRQLEILERQLQPLKVEVDGNAAMRINFIFPSLDPKIMFGGYISAFNLIQKLTEEGFSIRIIVTEPLDTSIDDICKQLPPASVLQECLLTSEVLSLHDRETTIPVSAEDVFIGYSWVTARLAHQAARDTNGKPFIYFIQEYEAVFHPLGSIHALCAATYDLRHYAIFNSHLLPNYFRQRQIGVYKRNPQQGESRSVHFLHAIADVKPPTVEELKLRKVRKLLFYARPEVYAARNLFEMGVMALKKAVTSEVFMGQWEFHGIGSLNTECKIQLDSECELKLLKRMDFDQYIKMLGQYDVGMSLMYAPHPSVPPLEMAAAGLVTVTSIFENRNSADMEAISGNLIAVPAKISTICSALGEAAVQASDAESRVKNAKFSWPRSWEDSFDEAFIRKLRTLIQPEAPSEISLEDAEHAYHNGHL